MTTNVLLFVWACLSLTMGAAVWWSPRAAARLGAMLRARAIALAELQHKRSVALEQYRTRFREEMANAE